MPKRKISQLAASLSSSTLAGEYIVDAASNVRSIKPYCHEYTAYAKGRWLGREILDVVTREFGSHPPAYWRRAIENGLVRVNDNEIPIDYKFRSGDSFSHLAHRHEPPVMGSVALVGETDSVLAVCKPPSMPMHPCGAYRFNSLMFVLDKEPVSATQGQIFLVHRLDRVTSGVVILAKSKQAASKISAEISSHQTEKTYLARVKGAFPPTERLEKMRRLDGKGLVDMAATFKYEEGEGEGEGIVAETVNELAKEKGGEVKPGVGGGNSKKKQRREAAAAAKTLTTTSYSATRRIAPFEELAQDATVGYGYDEATFPGFLLLRVPIVVVSHREGVHCCDAAGKTSISAFRSLGYCAESDTSLIECRPLTGRTHQLRLHLQFLGHPIANDPCYGGELFYGETHKRVAAAGAVRKMKQLGLTPLSKVPHFDHEEVLAEMARSSGVSAEGGSSAEGEGEGEVESGDVEVSASEEDAPRGPSEPLDDFLARTCQYCKLGGGNGGAELERLLHCDGIWLHAQRYRHSNGDWSFTAPLPTWAKNAAFKEWV